MKKVCSSLLFFISLVVATSTYAASKNRMVYGETGRLDTYDPYTVHEAVGQRLSDLLFDSLITVGPGGKYVSELAESWTISDGGTVVTFVLKDKVYWHDNSKQKLKRQFNAYDVATTVKLLLAEQSEIPNKERFAVISSVEPISNLEVKVRLKRAMTDPLRVMMFKILPTFALDGVAALRRSGAFAKSPIGTGPYMFDKVNAQGEVLLTANDLYFKGKPKIKNIVMKPYSDQNIMAQSLMFNALDLITYVSPRDLPEIMGDKKLTVTPYDALSFTFLALNTSKKWLRDKRVRKAIAHAVNRAEMLQAFFGGKGHLITGPFPITSWAYNLDVKPYSFDIKRARQLLEDAGLKDRNRDSFYDDAKGKPLTLLFAVPLTGESDMVKRLVLAVQEYLSQAGIKVELQFMDWLVWKKRVLGSHDYDMTIASWSFDDASNITSLFHSSSAIPWGNNFIMFKNTKVDSLLTEADVTNDVDKKRAIYHKLHSVISDESPYVFLWTLWHHAAHNVKVRGVDIEPFSFFKNITSWEVK